MRSALGPVLRDLQAAGGPVPRVEDDDWVDNPGWSSVMLWSADGSGAGVSVDLTAPEDERIAWVAGMVREWAIEDLWRSEGPTNWPPCPAHPDTHPATPAVRGTGAIWICPVNQLPVAKVGKLVAP